MTDQHPRPVTEIDTELAHTITRFNRLRSWAIFALAVVVIISIGVGWFVLGQQGTRLVASCSLYHDLGGLAVKPIPPVTRPSEAIVTIVVDARKAYVGECPGPIPPPDPSLVFWAHYYGLTVPGPGPARTTGEIGQ
jgi:hypothetical protein